MFLLLCLAVGRIGGYAFADVPRNARLRRAVRGLLLDRLGTTDRTRTDDAFERFVALVGA
jgi:hypothetical protein